MNRHLISLPVHVHYILFSSTGNANLFSLAYAKDFLCTHEYHKLSKDQFIVYDFCYTGVDIIHAGNPFHLVGGF